ncbi:NAD-dependent dehydratase [Bosea sp. RAF48]|uniref:NAD-dependent dehydratase n=1 Tax=Bosea sp. RAF48 TaxID=3237480 RepID=UPI003F8E609E
MKLMLVGATGLVGQQVLQLALADDRIDEVIAPGRRPLPRHQKLIAPIVEFERLPEDAPWWSVEAVICALGTTIRTAGSREAFYRVDHDFPLSVAQLTRRNGATIFVLNSAMGANAASRIFYSRVKGEVERDIIELGFPSLTIARPGLIGGERQEFRSGERLATSVLRILHPVLPRAWRINPADKIAAAMIEAAVAATPGTTILTSTKLL